jgi:hypothetical protein
VECEPVQPAFRVFGCHENASPGELLVVSVVAISLEAGLDESLFVFGEPGYGFGVVRDEPVGGNRNDNG